MGERGRGERGEIGEGEGRGGRDEGKGGCGRRDSGERGREGTSLFGTTTKAKLVHLQVDHRDHDRGGQKTAMMIAVFTRQR